MTFCNVLFFFFITLGIGMAFHRLQSGFNDVSCNEDGDWLSVSNGC